MRNSVVVQTKNTLVHILDIIFPPSDDALIVRALKVEKILMLKELHIIFGVYVCASFSHKELRMCIHEAKFHHNMRAIAYLGALLQTELKNFDNHVIIPIPLSKKRLRERGHNQVTSVIRAACTDKNYDLLLTNVLIRPKDTRPQTELTKDERMLNIKNAFEVVRPEKITGRNIVIIDDVVTTGATLHAAKSACEKHSPKTITLLALAH